MDKIAKVAELMDAAAVYIPFNDEAIRITACDHTNNCMIGEYEMEGTPVTIQFEDVDLTNDMFYKLVLMEIY